MKKIAVISGILLPLCVAAGAAWTLEKPYYVSLKIGGSFPNTSVASTQGVIAKGDYDNAFAVSAAVGIRLHPTVRMELEGGYRKFDIDKMTLGTATVDINGESVGKTLMVNAYYDLPVQWEAKPYIMGGLGGVRFDSKAQLGTLSERGHNTNFAYQLGGGFSYSLSETVTADVGYRYFGAKTEDEDGVIAETDTTTHEFLAGLRFGF